MDSRENTKIRWTRDSKFLPEAKLLPHQGGRGSNHPSGLSGKKLCNLTAHTELTNNHGVSTERVQGMDRIKQMHTQKYMRVIGDRSNVENELDPKRHHQNQLSPAIIQTK